MSDTIISVEGLGKKYVLSHQGERGGYTRFSERLEGWMKKPFAALAGSGRREVEGNLPPTSFHLPQPSHEVFWALKDVSFEVKRGEVVGIIGRNGAGKSTLLKILSRITEPSEGRVTLRGRVASLLEVGTGFHPELTGRENIFLNGAILGMTKAEIRKKFDEIVAFAEVERFLDTPVKRYSSGMYVRLAFAVAAHLEPEILVVDEVLAVGDAEFQKKCLGKMKDVATGGRTVLFVSHQLSAVKSLCPKAIWLEKGKIQKEGKSSNTISEYLKAFSQIPQAEGSLRGARREGTGDVRFDSIVCEDGHGRQTFSIPSGENCKIITKVINTSGQKYADCSFSLDFYDELGSRVLIFRTDTMGQLIPIDSRPLSISTTIETIPLAPGRYRVSLYIGKDAGDFYEFVENAANIQITEGDFFGTGHPGHPNLCKILHPFEINVNHP